MTLVGVLLAAGAGTRMGRPKALVSDHRGSWLLRTIQVLREGGCDDVVVVIGAAANQVRELLSDTPVDIIEATGWTEGLAASLRAGLGAAGEADSALVHLVDLPDVGADVIRRVASFASPDALVRAAYGERPGHPVLIGRDHWHDIIKSAVGDRGARDYLIEQRVRDVDCSDLADGLDYDEFPRPGR